MELPQQGTCSQRWKTGLASNAMGITVFHNNWSRSPGNASESAKGLWSSISCKLHINLQLKMRGKEINFMVSVTWDDCLIQGKLDQTRRGGNITTLEEPGKRKGSSRILLSLKRMWESEYRWNSGGLLPEELGRHYSHTKEVTWTHSYYKR